MSMCSRRLLQPRRGWMRRTTLRLAGYALPGSSVEYMDPFGPHTNRNLLTGNDSRLYGGHGYRAPAVRQCHVDDLLVPHRLDDADLGADDAVASCAVVSNLEMLGPDSEDDAPVAAGLAGNSDGEVGALKRTHPTASDPCEHPLEEIH